VAGLTLAAAGLSAAVDDPEPGEGLARVRVIVATRAASVAITTRDATVASYIPAVLAGPASLAVSRTGQTLQLSRNIAGQAAEVSFDIILADVAQSRVVTWNVTADSAAETSLEVYSLADSTRATLVDRFVATATSAQFASAPSLIPSAGRLEARPFMPRRVLAF